MGTPPVARRAVEASRAGCGLARAEYTRVGDGSGTGPVERKASVGSAHSRWTRHETFLLVRQLLHHRMEVRLPLKPDPRQLRQRHK